MGDGSIHRSSSNPQMEITNTNKRFLEWLDRELDWLSVSVKHKHDLGDNPCYRLTITRHPWLEELSLWYETGNKEFPKDLEITNTVAKMWYVCDGGIRWTDEYAYASIRAVNESNRGDILQSFFDFETTFSDNYVNFWSDTRNFLNWLGEPVPGFEYKWETDNFEKYKSLKDKSYNVNDDNRDNQ